MDKLPPLDETYLVDTLLDLSNITNPTAYTDQVIRALEKKLTAIPDLNLRRNAKGALVASWAGNLKTNPRGLTAHVDTLGAMVKEIKPNGRLKLTLLGEPIGEQVVFQWLSSGPGVDASHNYERTHKYALVATTRWIMTCLLN